MQAHELSTLIMELVLHRAARLGDFSLPVHIRTPTNRTSIAAPCIHIPSKPVTSYNLAPQDFGAHIRDFMPRDTLGDNPSARLRGAGLWRAHLLQILLDVPATAASVLNRCRPTRRRALA